MAKRTEMVELTKEDVEQAVQDWLNSKYGSYTEKTEWDVRIYVHQVYDDQDYATATGTRDID